MALLRVNFTFHTGLKHKRFSNVLLSGSWDATGKFSNQWSKRWRYRRTGPVAMHSPQACRWTERSEWGYDSDPNIAPQNKITSGIGMKASRRTIRRRTAAT